MPTVALPHPTSADRLRAADAPLWLQAVGVAGFAALTAVFAQAELRIYLWEIPLTLQTVAVYASGLFLGRRNGALAMGLYLLLGLALPIYAGGGTGLDHLLGMSAGYLLAFPVVAFAVGQITRTRRTALRTVLALVAGSVILFASGVAGLALTTDLTLAETVVAGWVRFIPWDLTKIALVTGLYVGTRRATG